MEIVGENWLVLLMEKAVLPYVGAVGAKLLYPDTDIIQHAGITNLRVLSLIHIYLLLPHRLRVLPCHRVYLLRFPQAYRLLPP